MIGSLEATANSLKSENKCMVTPAIGSLSFRNSLRTWQERKRHHIFSPRASTLPRSTCQQTSTQISLSAQWQSWQS